jgi:hypothetical protein
MRKWTWLILAATISPVLAGCGSAEPVAEPKAEDDPAKVAENVEEAPDPVPDLAELLAKPRPELAALADRWGSRAEQQQYFLSHARVRFALLPTVRLPLAVPVFRKAKYSEVAGFSLPPYLSEATRDPAVALHLARYGDAEAARKLADPATRAKIDALRLGRNYPVEWTRLVALILQHTQFRLATGDTGAVEELSQIHEQLRQVLDEPARRGPLGAALLTPGREVLRQAADVWRLRKDEDDVAKVESILKSWGEVPGVTPPLPAGSPAAEAARLLGAQPAGKDVVTLSPLRALDLLDVPLPDENVEAIVAFFDNDRLREVLIAYRLWLNAEFTRTAQLGFCLQERAAGEDVPGELPRRRYRLPGLTCDVLLTPGNQLAGALVRLGGDEAAPAPQLDRDLGIVHLSRSFEQNRLRVAPRLPPPRVHNTDPRALAQLTTPLPAALLGKVTLDREPQADVVQRVTVSFAPSSRLTLLQAALPLWQAFGPGRIETGNADGSRYAAFVWEDEQSRYDLRLPITADEPPALLLADQTATWDLARRTQRAQALDRQERRQRLEAQKAQARLPRDLEGLQLGQARAEALAALPAGEAVQRHDLPDGVLLTFPNAPAGRPRVPRELLVHFGPDRCVTELRVRYADAPGTKPGATRQFLEELKNRCGAARVRGAGKAEAVYEWADDVTLLACRQDAVGVDVTVRERAADEDADTARPVRYLPCGLEGCVLGLSQEALFKNWSVHSAPAPGQPVVLAPKESDAYDALLAWLDRGRVVRVVARHRAAGNLELNEVGRALAAAWGRAEGALGWPRRQETAVGGQVLGWSNHDDVTRVRVFWQQNLGEAPRLYTEWQDVGRP